MAQISCVRRVQNLPATVALRRSSPIRKRSESLHVHAGQQQVRGVDRPRQLLVRPKVAGDRRRVESSGTKRRPGWAYALLELVDSETYAPIDLLEGIRVPYRHQCRS